MKCAFHIDKDAVAQCVDCGKGLCKDCADLYKPILCTDCAKIRNDSEQKKLLTTLIISIGLLFVSFFILTTYNNGTMELGILIMQTFLVAGIPWGWITLNKLTSNLFLFLPIIGWVFYVMIKLFLSYIIGVFAMIYKISISIYKLVKNNKMETYIHENNTKV